MSAARTRPAARRQQDIREVALLGMTAIVGIGRDGSGRVIEVFGEGCKDSPVADAARDAAIMISLALQCGLTAAELARAVTRASDGGPASLTGALVLVAAEEDTDARRADWIAQGGAYVPVKGRPR